MAVLEDLTEEEEYLLALMLDISGIDLAEFLWVDETNPDGVFRCYDYQYSWYRCRDKNQIDQAGRSVGKSLGIQMRAFAFPFHSPGEEMLLTAPELIHLNPITERVEERILDTRISREMLNKSGGKTGFTHRPFEASFVNGAKIIGRIPHKDGKGVKGMHPKQLEQDEAQDYPEAGWVELGETLKYGNPDAIWRAHGVSRGVPDRFKKQTDPNSGWTVHRITGMHKPDWTAEERKAKAALYGSRDHPDFRRNILGLHGNAQSAIFVLSRLMATVDTIESSAYNLHEYHHVRISDEMLRDSGMNIASLLELPGRHKMYEAVWAGMDVGLTSDPSEILVMGEHMPVRSGKNARPEPTLKLLARINLQRISAPVHREVVDAVCDHYRVKCFAFDGTGIGLPIWQEIQGGTSSHKRKIKSYNFSQNIFVGYEAEDEERAEEEWDYQPEEIHANVLEYSTDMLRLLVDTSRMQLPYDEELIRQFAGQTYHVSRSNTNPYGRKVFSKGSYHALDAARMAVLGYFQHQVGAMIQGHQSEPVLDSFVAI